MECKHLKAISTQSRMEEGIYRDAGAILTGKHEGGGRPIPGIAMLGDAVAVSPPHMQSTGRDRSISGISAGNTRY